MSISNFQTNIIFDIVFHQVPAAAPLKSDWKENVFWLSGGEEDRVQYWQARWATGQSQWNSEKPHQYLVKVSLSAAAAVLVSSDPTLLMHSIWMCWPEDPRVSASSCLCAARLETSCTSTTKVTGPDQRQCWIQGVTYIHLISGHTVTGVEGVPFVVEQFFRENKLEYEKVCQICVVPDRNELFG